MILGFVVLIIATGLFLFYLQLACHRILRREFDQPYFRSIVEANKLEFPLVRRTLEDRRAPVNYPGSSQMLKCDFQALAYLLKHAANLNQRYSRDERLLLSYFRLVWFGLAIRHWLRLQEKPTMLKLIAILQYFANVVGLRVHTVRFGSGDPLGYLSDLI